jgi:hypothetical protein
MPVPSTLADVEIGSCGGGAFSALIALALGATVMCGAPLVEEEMGVAGSAVTEPVSNGVAATAADPLATGEAGAAVAAAILAMRWRSHWRVGVAAGERAGCPGGELARSAPAAPSGVLRVGVRSAGAAASLAESVAAVAAAALVLVPAGAWRLSRTPRTTDSNRSEAELV